MTTKVAPDVTGTNGAVNDIPQESQGLRRAVGDWGSYTWGYADVGADVYVALGIVMAAAQGATNVAFLFAGLVYVMVGLAYTELAAAYPMAGGGQFYVLRGLGDLMGFVAGWAVLLDFTIDISLFALASAGYINFFVPALNGHVNLIVFGLTIPGVQPFLILEATFLVVMLTLLNILGVRESSRFNEILGALDIMSESAILFFGFLFAFNPTLLIHQLATAWPDPYHLAYGASLVCQGTLEVSHACAYTCRFLRHRASRTVACRSFTKRLRCTCQHVRIRGRNRLHAGVCLVARSSLH